MKKIIFTLFVFLLANSFVCADEIIDSKGVVIPCTIETVSGGLIEYSVDGSSYSFVRELENPVFNDYVDVKINLRKRDEIKRYFGQLVFKDKFADTKIQTEEGYVQIPWYRVKYVGVYKP